jgi:hypothetical protein
MVEDIDTRVECLDFEEYDHEECDHEEYDHEEYDHEDVFSLSKRIKRE